MTFETRLAAAHRELTDKGMQELNYNPPLFRLLRRLGLRLRPPHYERFLVHLLAFGLPTGAIWGVLMWYFDWQDEVNPTFALRQSALFGIGFGLLMGIIVWMRRKQLKLTPWDALPHSTSRTQKRWQPK
ncbi:DUF6404 family protein [Aeromonas media]|uniref:DUF6404 family protein n=1 Tax=Aeromonas media TaxID=651 RepID=UPI0024C12A32|nr:DUF6404 family protein [Aeromonas media]MDM5075507.1 DUF6404 family protein [Aeromonas media]